MVENGFLEIFFIEARLEEGSTHLRNLRVQAENLSIQ